MSGTSPDPATHAGTNGAAVGGGSTGGTVSKL